MVAAAFFSAQSAFAAVAQWETVDVTVHPEQNGGVLLISGQLPGSVTLPAQAELAVPAGGELQWIGQILGGAASADPELQYAKRTVGGWSMFSPSPSPSHVSRRSRYPSRLPSSSTGQPTLRH